MATSQIILTVDSSPLDEAMELISSLPDETREIFIERIRQLPNLGIEFGPIKEAMAPVAHDLSIHTCIFSLEFLWMDELRALTAKGVA